MENFAPLKFHLRLMGILKWDNSLRAKNNTILRNCIVLGSSILFLSTTGLFVIFKAKTQKETATATVFLMSGIFMKLWYILLIWNKEKIEKLFDDMDVIIQKRKINTLNISDVKLRI